MRAFSTFKIFPRIGRTAWFRESRPPFVEPPAESPSTMYNSHLVGSVHWQSANFPGIPRPSSKPFRLRLKSRALRAATRAAAASMLLRTISLPSAGFCSNQDVSSSLTIFCVKVFASELPSLVFVCPSNCGSASLIETIAVKPSRTSSPVRRSSFLRIKPCSSPNLLTIEVKAVRKPSSCAPPSWV